MTTGFELTQGCNRALVCYCKADELSTFDFDNAIYAVFESQNIDIATGSGSFICDFGEPQSALNIALQWADTSRNLKVGGSFSDVCVGVFFYDAPEPIDTRGTMAEVNEFFGEEIEPEPQPSLTELVCDALRDTFGGVYGASAFVIPNTVTEFTLEVE